MQKANRIGRMVAVLAAACALGAAGDARSSPAGGTHAGLGGAQGAAPTARSLPQIMARRAGEYTREIQFLNASGPQGAPFAGTSKISVILDGHFVLEENHDVVFGKPVDGMRIYGFNSATGNYELASLYSMSSAILMFTGTSSDGGQTMNLSGESATAKGEKQTLHLRFRQLDDDQFVATVAIVGADGKEAPFQETTYKRKK